MRTVIIKRTGMENFCCFINPFVIDFDRNEFVLVVGPNGSGKTSSITNSLMFTLYGVTTKGGRGSDVVNDKIKKNCHTFVEFSINSDEYRVDRYYADSKHGNDVILMKNNNIIKRGHREVLPEIEKLLVPQKLFTNTLLFAQKVKAFFTDLTDSEQKEIFRKVLLLDDYVLYQKETKNKSKECSNKIQEIDTEIVIRVRMLDDNKNQIESLKIQKENFYKKAEEDKNNLLKSLEDYETNLKKNKMYEISEKFENLEEQEKIVDEKINKLSSDINSIDSKLESSLSELNYKKDLKLSELKSAVESKKSEIEKNTNILLNEEKSNFDRLKEGKEKEVRSITETIQELTFNGNQISKEHQKLTEEIKEFNSSSELNNEVVCPTCKQKVSGESKEIIEKHLKEIKDQESKLVKDLVKIIEARKIKTEHKDNLNNELSSLYTIHQQEIQKVMDYKTKELNLIDSKLSIAIDKVNEQTEKMRNSILSNSENKEEMEKELNYYKNRKEELKLLINEKSQVVSWIKVLENNIQKTKEDLKRIEQSKYDDSIIEECLKKEKTLSKEIETYQELKNKEEIRLKVLDFWDEGFSSSGIPSMLIDEAIPFMNERVSNYLEEISNGRYSVSFDTLKATKSGEFRDKISVNVFDNVTHADSRVKISGGQERIIDIAIILTLSDLQSNVQDMRFNLLLFDEIFDSLDDANVEYVSRILRLISKSQNKSIFVISHNPIDQFECDRILRF